MTDPQLARHPVWSRFAIPVAICVVVLISFRAYSPRYYILLNSDDALNVLMANDHELPKDLYCWGQDRGGTLIPLLSQPLITLGFSPVWAVSIVGHLLLLGGFWGFSRLLRSPWLHLLLAIAWFMPPYRVVDMLRFPFGMQYALLGIGIGLVVTCPPRGERSRRRQMHLAGLALIPILALWTSDLFITSLTAIGSLLLFRKSWRETDRSIVRWIGAGVVVALVFVAFAKSTATSTEQYVSFNDLQAVGTVLVMMAKGLFALFTFKVGEPFMSAYLWAALLVAPFLVRYARSNSSNDRWVLLFFALDALLLFGTVLVSQWAYLNGLAPRYFIGIYIDPVLIALILFDRRKLHKGADMATLALAGCIVIGAVGTLAHLRWVWPGTLASRVDIAAEFEELAPVGLIGDYWNSYISSVSDPDRIKATPHDRSEVRSQEIVGSVFDGRPIYLLKDMWLPAFPDTIEQFGHTLVGTGPSRTIGSCTARRYMVQESSTVD